VTLWVGGIEFYEKGGMYEGEGRQGVGSKAIKVAELRNGYLQRDPIINV
jgi:hypothetical protein